MAEEIVEKPVCGNCGADVRPDTQFCYNCGKSVSEGGNESLADLEKALAASRVNAGDSKAKLELAAAERRRARITSRKPPEVVWEAPTDGSNRLYFLIALMIFVLAVGIVLLTVFFK
jgi:hypothetical protein